MPFSLWQWSFSFWKVCGQWEKACNNGITRFYILLPKVLGVKEGNVTVSLYERRDIFNHRQIGCLLNRLFELTTHYQSPHRLPVVFVSMRGTTRDQWSHSERLSNKAESISMLWCYIMNLRKQQLSDTKWSLKANNLTWHKRSQTNFNGIDL